MFQSRLFLAVSLSALIAVAQNGFAAAQTEANASVPTAAGEALVGRYYTYGCYPGIEGCDISLQELMDAGDDIFNTTLSYAPNATFDIVREITPGLYEVRWVFGESVTDGVFQTVPCEETDAPGKPYDKTCLSGIYAGMAFPDFCGTDETSPCEHSVTAGTSPWGPQFAAFSVDEDDEPVIKSIWTQVGSIFFDESIGSGLEVFVKVRADSS